MVLLLLTPLPTGRRGKVGRRNVVRRVRRRAVPVVGRCRFSCSGCCCRVVVGVAVGRRMTVRRRRRQREEVGKHGVDVLRGRGEDEAFEDPVLAHFPPERRLRMMIRCRRRHARGAVDIVRGRRAGSVHDATTTTMDPEHSRGAQRTEMKQRNREKTEISRLDERRAVTEKDAAAASSSITKVGHRGRRGRTALGRGGL
jgi:hypothetical protein